MNYYLFVLLFFISYLIIKIVTGITILKRNSIITNFMEGIVDIINIFIVLTILNYLSLFFHFSDGVLVLNLVLVFIYWFLYLKIKELFWKRRGILYKGFVGIEYLTLVSTLIIWYIINNIY